jgi:hypothetical protein
MIAPKGPGRDRRSSVLDQKKNNGKALRNKETV